MVTLYGIPNCDTMRKARAWLSARGVDHRFHDYRKDGMDTVPLDAWTERAGWEALLNRTGTTFRNLPEATRADLTRERAVAIMRAHPATIKRPVLVDGERVAIGFAPDRYAGLFG